MITSEFTAGLRALADFYDSRPSLPIPSNPRFDVWLWDKTSLMAVVRTAGKVEKLKLGSQYILRKHFGPVELDFNINQEEVCERVVRGRREIPEQYVPAHTEEIVEWRCPESLLAEEVEP